MYKAILIINLIDCWCVLWQIKKLKCYSQNSMSILGMRFNTWSTTMCNPQFFVSLKIEFFTSTIQFRTCPPTFQSNSCCAPVSSSENSRREANLDWISLVLTISPSLASTRFGSKQEAKCLTSMEITLLKRISQEWRRIFLNTHLFACSTSMICL